MLAEFNRRRHGWPRGPAATLYFGGGTPSLLHPAAVDRVIQGVELQSEAEITLEANPEDVNAQVVALWKRSGVNRVSLGIQSFDDKILLKLGRKHRAAEAWRAVELCVGIMPKMTVDIIYGVPGESTASIEQSVHKLWSLGVRHVSAYLLTVEPGTVLERHIQGGRAQALDDDYQADAYEHLQGIMADVGYTQYEVSSFALSGHESRHNRHYWGKGPYLGLGPAAHSLRFLEDGSVERSHNPASLREWKLEATPSQETLKPEEALLETIAFGLRDLRAGVRLSELEARHKCAAPEQLRDVILRAQNRGWLTSQAGVWRLTQTGVRFADAVARDILGVKG